MDAAEITEPSPMKTWSPMWSGKKATPLLNCLKGGRMTEFFEIIQYRPVLTFAKSPRTIAPLSTMTFPCSTMFWLPQSTVCRFTCELLNKFKLHSMSHSLSCVSPYSRSLSRQTRLCCKTCQRFPCFNTS